MNVTDEDKLWGAAGWTPFVGWIPALIVLFIEEKKQRPFIRYNSVQSLAFSAVASILTIMGTLALLAPGCIVLVAWLAYAIYLVIQSYQGKWVTVPLVTDFCKSQGWID